MIRIINRLYDFIIPEGERNRNFGLDLIRATAIIVVIFGHSSYLLKGIPFLSKIRVFDGVDLFFVLSGFLIGQIFIKKFINIQHPRFSDIIVFMIRRWFRTMPNYYIFLAFNLVCAYFLVEHRFEAFDWRYLFFLQNFLPYTSEHGFFPEAWSLAVEEWFYLLFPISTMFFLKVFKANTGEGVLSYAVLTILAVTIGRILILSELDIQNYSQYDEMIRKVVVLRLDSIAIGILGAFIFLRNYCIWKRWLIQKFFLGITGVVLLTIAIRYYSFEYSFSWFAILYSPLLSFSFLLTFPLLYTWSQNASTIGRVVTIVSVVSYSMYLIHYSLLIIPLKLYCWPDNGFSALLQFILVWLVTLLLSVLNYKYLESKITRLRDKLS